MRSMGYQRNENSVSTGMSSHLKIHSGILLLKDIPLEDVKNVGKQSSSKAILRKRLSLKRSCLVSNLKKNIACMGISTQSLDSQFLAQGKLDVSSVREIQPTSVMRFFGMPSLKNLRLNVLMGILLRSLDLNPQRAESVAGNAIGLDLWNTLKDAGQNWQLLALSTFRKLASLTYSKLIALKVILMLTRSKEVAENIVRNAWLKASPVEASLDRYNLLFGISYSFCAGIPDSRMEGEGGRVLNYPLQTI